MNEAKIIFKGFEDDGTIASLIQEKYSKLYQISPKIFSCHIAVERLQNKKHKRHSYHLRIDLKLPGHHEIVIKRDPPKNDVQNQTLNTIIRESFEAARRQIIATLEKQKSKIKLRAQDDPVLTAYDAPEE